MSALSRAPNRTPFIPGFHLPYNSFVAAVDYFEEAYKRKDMGFVVSSTNSYMVCASVILNVVLVNKIKMHA